MANDPNDIPIRSNQDEIKASWFNTLRTFLIDAFGAVSGEASFTISNNQSSLSSLGFSVDALSFTSAKIPFEVSRSSSAENRVEVGELNLYYKNSTWYLVFGSSYGDNSMGDGFGFSISQAGTVANIMYTSDNIAGTGYAGNMKLKATYFTV